MRFASLGSGSEGNCLVVEAGTTRVLVDCGFGVREMTSRLGRLGLEPSYINAILVTHEHTDHIGGVPAFAARHRIAVWGSFGTLAATAQRFEGMSDVYAFDSHVPFALGALEITPIPVPHDAREPTQFVLGDGATRLGVLTDIGVSTPHVEAVLSGCEALVLEANHCQELLAQSDYPYPLKQRIAGRLGHLDNEAAAGLLRRIDRTRLRHVVAAHLSQQNNTPAKARGALAAALDCSEDWIGVATQAEGFGWRDL